MNEWSLLKSGSLSRILHSGPSQMLPPCSRGTPKFQIAGSIQIVVPILPGLYAEDRKIGQFRWRLTQGWPITCWVAGHATATETMSYVTEISSHICLSAHRYCGKPADWILMPFGVVRWGRARKGYIRFWWWCQRGRSSLRGEFAASHCNNGDFVASLCGSA